MTDKELIKSEIVRRLAKLGTRIENNSEKIYEPGMSEEDLKYHKRGQDDKLTSLSARANELDSLLEFIDIMPEEQQGNGIYFREKVWSDIFDDIDSLWRSKEADVTYDIVSADDIIITDEISEKVKKKVEEFKKK